MTKTRLLRIGRINFANVWPIFYHFPYEQFVNEIEFVSQVPTRLNEKMARGEIEMGPISSFAYGESFEQYELFPDLSVSSFGTVHSILLFHRKPLEEIYSGSFALPTTSATSVNLLKILIEKFAQGTPSYSFASPALDVMMVGNDATLLIGDDAIKAQWANKEYLVTDLGAEWNKMTGQWMSYAIWAVNKQTIARQPELVGRIHQAFQQSKRLSLANLNPLAADAKKSLGGDTDYWRRYFNVLNYDFGVPQRTGLQLYYDYALEMKLLDRKVPLQIWCDKSVTQVKE